MNEYAERDLGELDDHYYRHVNAMTGEKLHSKSAIAAELAWRDQHIAELETALGVATDYIVVLEHCADGYYRVTSSDEAKAWEAVCTSQTPK